MYVTLWVRPSNHCMCSVSFLYILPFLYKNSQSSTGRPASIPIYGTDQDEYVFLVAGNRSEPDVWAGCLTKSRISF